MSSASLGLGVGDELGVAFGERAGPTREERILRGAEALPEGVVGVLVGPARGLPLGHEVAEPGGGGAPVLGVGELLGLVDQLLLAGLAARALPVEIGEVRTAATVERLAGREKRFQSCSSVLRSIPRIVRHSSRIALNRSPACFHWVASAASVSASAASSSLRATAAARWASRAARAAATACLGVRDELVEAGAQPDEVADDGGFGETVAQGRAR